MDEEVRVEGSSDSVVLERLCAAFEKKGAGAEGKGVRVKDERGGRVLSAAWEWGSVLVCHRKSSDKACKRRGWGEALSAQMSVHAL